MNITYTWRECDIVTKMNRFITCLHVGISHVNDIEIKLLPNIENAFSTRV